MPTGDTKTTIAWELKALSGESINTRTTHGKILSINDSIT